MAKVFFRVAPVEGRQVVDPFTVGSSQHRRIGYERVIDGTVRRAGKEEPRVRYKLTSEVALVKETSDHYVRKAILAGDLEYVETVFDAGESTERVKREADLVLATAKHKQAREAEKAAAVAAEQANTAAEALALEAAELGLTVEQFNAES